MTPRFLVLALVAALASCGDEGPVEKPYAWNDLRMITNYTAKAVCTCLFVEERNNEECVAYSKQAPPVATWSADLEAKTVDASALLLWGARARWVGEKFGCVIE